MPCQQTYDLPEQRNEYEEISNIVPMTLHGKNHASYLTHHQPRMLSGVLNMSEVQLV